VKKKLSPLVMKLNTLKPTGQEVFIYRNLHKNCWSIRDVKSRLVIGHATSLTLKGCTFKVSETGRKRVVREGRKNVHAGIQGLLISVEECCIGAGKPAIKYNPYKNKSFMCLNKPIFNAEEVVFHITGVSLIKRSK